MIVEEGFTQTRAIFGDVVSIAVIVALGLEMENKYSGTLLRLEG
jgi:hypothetical protein